MAYNHLDRISAASLGKPRELPSGAVVYHAVLATEGVLQYKRNGVIFRERVPASTLRDPAFLAGLERAPVTIEHIKRPNRRGQRLVDAANAKEEIHGDVANVRYVEGVGLVGEVALRTQDALTYVKRGGWGISLSYVVEPEDMDLTPGIDPVYGEYHATQMRRLPNSLCITTNARSHGAQLRLDSANEDLYIQDDDMALPPKKQDPSTEAPAEGEQKPAAQGAPAAAPAEGEQKPAGDMPAEGAPGEMPEQDDPTGEEAPGAEGAAMGEGGNPQPTEQPIPPRSLPTDTPPAPTMLDEQQVNQIADLVASRVIQPLLAMLSTNFGEGSMFAASLGRIGSLGDRFDGLLAAPRLDSGNSDEAALERLLERRMNVEKLANLMNIPADQRGHGWRDLEKHLVRAVGGPMAAERLDSAGSEDLAEIVITMGLRNAEASRGNPPAKTDDGNAKRVEYIPVRS
jgi:hypothetical protein